MVVPVPSCGQQHGAGDAEQEEGDECDGAARLSREPGQARGMRADDAPRLLGQLPAAAGALEHARTLTVPNRAGPTDDKRPGDGHGDGRHDPISLTALSRRNSNRRSETTGTTP